MSHNTDVSPAFSQLGDSLAQAAESQRAAVPGDDQFRPQRSLPLR